MKQIDLEAAKFEMVETVESLERMIDLLKKEDAIGVDLENHWYRSFQGKRQAGCHLGLIYLIGNFQILEHAYGWFYPLPSDKVRFSN